MENLRKQNITILIKIEKLSKKPPNPDDVKKKPLTDSFWKPNNLNLNVDSAHDKNSMMIEMIFATWTQRTSATSGLWYPPCLSINSAITWWSGHGQPWSKPASKPTSLTAASSLALAASLSFPARVLPPRSGLLSRATSKACGNGLEMTIL